MWQGDSKKSKNDFKPSFDDEQWIKQVQKLLNRMARYRLSDEDIETIKKITDKL
jgi:hypothetical protein